MFLWNLLGQICGTENGRPPSSKLLSTSQNGRLLLHGREPTSLPSTNIATPPTYHHSTRNKALSLSTTTSVKSTNSRRTASNLFLRNHQPTTAAFVVSGKPPTGRRRSSRSMSNNNNDNHFNDTDNTMKSSTGDNNNHIYHTISSGGSSTSTSSETAGKLLRPPCSTTAAGDDGGPPQRPLSYNPTNYNNNTSHYSRVRIPSTTPNQYDGPEQHNLQHNNCSAAAFGGGHHATTTTTNAIKMSSSMDQHKLKGSLQSYPNNTNNKQRIPQKIGTGISNSPRKSGNSGSAGGSIGRSSRTTRRSWNEEQQDPFYASKPKFPTDFAGLLRENAAPVPPALLRVLPPHSINVAPQTNPNAVRPKDASGKLKVCIRVGAGSENTTNPNGSSPNTQQQFSPQSPNNSLAVDSRKKQLTLTEPPSTTTGASSARSARASVPKIFGFDHVFTQDDTLSEICCGTLVDVIQTVVGGNDGCLLSFGHVNPAKINTLIGTHQSPNTIGLLPTAISWFFRVVNEARTKSPEIRFSVRVSAVEVSGHNEVLRDLLANFNGVGPPQSSSLSTAGPSSSGDIALIDDPVQGVQIQGASELRVQSPDKAAFYLDAALAMRNYGTVEERRNSHLFFTLHLYQHKLDAGKSQVAGGRSRLHLIDLGSGEKSSKSGRCALTLPAIGNVLLTLLQGQKYLPFKDSKLVSLLKDAMGTTNCRAVSVLATVSNDADRYFDTLNTAQIAGRLHRIRRQKKTKLGIGSQHSSGGENSSCDERGRRRFPKSASDPDCTTSSSEQSCDTVIYLGDPKHRRLGGNLSGGNETTTDGDSPPSTIPLKKASPSPIRSCPATPPTPRTNPMFGLTGSPRCGAAPVQFHDNHQILPPTTKPPQQQQKLGSNETWIDGPKASPIIGSDGCQQVDNHQKQPEMSSAARMGYHQSRSGGFRASPSHSSALTSGNVVYMGQQSNEQWIDGPKAKPIPTTNANNPGSPSTPRHSSAVKRHSKEYQHSTGEALLDPYKREMIQKWVTLQDQQRRFTAVSNSQTSLEATQKWAQAADQQERDYYETESPPSLPQPTTADNQEEDEIISPHQDVESWSNMDVTSDLDSKEPSPAIETRDIALQVEESEIDYELGRLAATSHRLVGNWANVAEQEIRYLEDIQEESEDNVSSSGGRSSTASNSKSQKPKILSDGRELSNELDKITLDGLEMLGLSVPSKDSSASPHPLRILSREAGMANDMNDSFSFTSEHFDSLSLPGTDQLNDEEVCTDEELEKAMAASMTSIRSHEILQQLKTEAKQAQQCQTESTSMSTTTQNVETSAVGTQNSPTLHHHNHQYNNAHAGGGIKLEVTALTRIPPLELTASSNNPVHNYYHSSQLQQQLSADSNKIDTIHQQHNNSNGRIINHHKKHAHAQQQSKSLNCCTNMMGSSSGGTSSSIGSGHSTSGNINNSFHHTVTGGTTSKQHSTSLHLQQQQSSTTLGAGKKIPSTVLGLGGSSSCCNNQQQPSSLINTKKPLSTSTSLPKSSKSPAANPHHQHNNNLVPSSATNKQQLTSPQVVSSNRQNRSLSDTRNPTTTMNMVSSSSSSSKLITVRSPSVDSNPHQQQQQQQQYHQQQMMLMNSSTSFITTTNNQHRQQFVGPPTKAGWGSRRDSNNGSSSINQTSASGISMQAGSNGGQQHSSSSIGGTLPKPTNKKLVTTISTSGGHNSNKKSNNIPSSNNKHQQQIIPPRHGARDGGKESSQSTPSKKSTKLPLINFLRSPSKSSKQKQQQQQQQNNTKSSVQQTVNHPPPLSHHHNHHQQTAAGVNQSPISVVSSSSNNNTPANRASSGYDSGHDSGIVPSGGSPQSQTSSANITRGVIVRHGSSSSSSNNNNNNSNNATNNSNSNNNTGSSNPNGPNYDPVTQSPYHKVTKPRNSQRSSSGHGSDNSSIQSNDILTTTAIITSKLQQPNHNTQNTLQYQQQNENSSTVASKKNQTSPTAAAKPTNSSSSSGQHQKKITSPTSKIAHFLTGKGRGSKRESVAGASSSGYESAGGYGPILQQENVDRSPSEAESPGWTNNVEDDGTAAGPASIKSPPSAKIGRKKYFSGIVGIPGVSRSKSAPQSPSGTAGRFFRLHPTTSSASDAKRQTSASNTSNNSPALTNTVGKRQDEVRAMRRVQRQVTTIRSKQKVLKDELRAAKQRIGVPDDRWSYDLHVLECMGLEEPGLLEALDAETHILEKRVTAARSHVMMTTSFDAKPITHPHPNQHQQHAVNQ